MTLIRFRCPSGHKLKAPRQYGGRNAVCPACQASVEIPAAEVTESGVARMLTVLNDESSVDHRHAVPAPQPESSGEVSSLKLTAGRRRPCDRCRKEIPESSTVCMHCQTIQFPSGSRIRSLMHVASRKHRGR